MNKAVGRLSIFAAIAFLSVACGEGEGEAEDGATPTTSETPSTPSTPAPSANTAPTITGVPAVSATAGVQYSFLPSASDADGDALSFDIVNRPTWASFDSSSGRLQGTPSSAHVGVYPNIRISVSDGEDSTALPAFEITVTGAGGGGGSNTAPTITGIPAGSVEQDAPYSFAPTAEDGDGDALSFSIENLPAWASFDPVSGTLQGTPGPADVGTHADILITVSDGQLSASLDPFAITVTATGTPNTAPRIWGSPTTVVREGNAYSFRPSAADDDGDSLAFSVQNQPSWATFSSTTGRIFGTPGAADVGEHGDITITVSDGEDNAALPPFTIQVNAAPVTNTPPTITGTPAATVQEGVQYSFTPGSGDDDGDPLTFSITGRPSWATFNTTTGRLQGTPGAANVGTFSNITISVSDGQDSDSLGPFSIAVTAAPAPNTPPTISGTPSGSVLQDSFYSFTPSASDDDGDPLTFSITGRPSWATFSTSTGRLQGTPDASDIGTYNDIAISVSDGEDTTSLTIFGITVMAAATGSATLTWLPPTENTDGSPLLNLAGYTVHWGTTSGNYTSSVTIENPGVTTYVVDNLVSGTYYFATRAFNTGGLQSDYSNEASKTIQ